MKNSWSGILRLAIVSGLILPAACDKSEHDEPKAGPPPVVNAAYPQFQLTVETYADCDALNADMRDLLATRREEERRYRAWQEAQRREWESSGVQGATSANEAMSDDGAASDSASESMSESFTNTQEAGVDEADHFKIGKHHLYASLERRIEVIQRASLAHLGSIDLEDLVNVTLYTLGEEDSARLVVVGERPMLGEPVEPNGQYELSSTVSGTVSSFGPTEPYRPVIGPSTTEVRIYDASTTAMPTLKTTKTYPGKAFDSRSVGGHLLLVFSDYLWLEDPAFKPYGGDYAYGYGYGGWLYDTADLDAPAADQPVRLDAAGTINGTPCNAIMKQTVADYDLRLTRVVSVDTAAPDAPAETAAVLGGGDQIYMSTSGLYIAKTGTEWFPWATYAEDDVHATPQERVVVTRVLFDAKTGKVAPVAAGAVAGRIKDEWSFKEFADHDVLAVATSTGHLWDTGANIAQNHLWILKANAETTNLDVVAAIRDFGTGEDIRSVRYVGSTAYVVTFKKTDPLFAFDLADPTAPKLLGELKIPGFSVYMHPVPGDLLVGIGFDAAEQGDFAYYQGLQVSLFDVKDPTNMARIDNVLVGSRGSYSEVTSDHHAFFYDAETSLMAVPVVELAGGSGQSWDYGTSLAFSGAIVYQVGRELTERARISHADLMPASCQEQLQQGRWWQDAGMSLDVNRVFKVDGRLLSFSRFGLRAHPLASPGATETTVAFPDTAALCQATSY